MSKELKKYREITIIKERDKENPIFYKYTIVENKTGKVLDEYFLNH